MANEMEVARLVARLVGDAASYQKMLRDVERDTRKTANVIEKVMDVATGGITKIARFLAKLVSMLPNVGSAFSGAVSKVKEFTSALLSLPSRVGSAISGIGNIITGLGQKVAQLGMQFTVMMAPLALLGGQARNESVKFSTALQRLVSLVGFSQDEVNGLRQQFLDLSGPLATSATDLVATYETIASGGLKGKSAMEAMTIAAKGAAIGMGDAATVGRTVSLAMTAYGEEALSATRATDILRAAAEAGNAEAAQFAPVFGRLLPMAIQLGLEFEEVAGSIAYATRMTGDASVAATGLSGVMSKLLGAGLRKDIKDSLGDAGLKQIQAVFRDRGMQAGLADLDTRLKAAGFTLREFFTDKEASDMIWMLTNDVKGFAGVLDTTANSVGGVERMFAMWEQGPGAAMAKQLAQMKSLLIEIGDLMAPAFGQFLEFSRSLMNIWKQLTPQIQKVVGIVIASAAAIGPAMGFISGGLLTLGTTISSIGSAITFVLTPLGLLTAAAAAFAVAVVQIKGLNVVGMFGGMRAGIVDLQKFVEGFVANFMVNVQILADWLKETWGNLWGEIKGPMTDYWNTFKSYVAEILPVIESFLSKTIGFFFNFRTNMTAIRDWIGDSWTKVLENMGYNFSVFGDRLVKSWIVVRDAMIEGAVEIGKGLFKAVGGSMAALAGNFALISRMIATGDNAGLTSLSFQIADKIWRQGQAPEGKSATDALKEIWNPANERDQFKSMLADAPQLNLNGPQGGLSGAMGRMLSSDLIPNLPEFKLGQDEAGAAGGGAAANAAAEGVKKATPKLQEMLDNANLKADVNLTPQFDAVAWNSAEAVSRLRSYLGSITRTSGGPVAAMAGGGFVPRGTDTVPAMLSPGEYVVNAGSARRYLSTLNRINYMADGGSLLPNAISPGTPARLAAAQVLRDLEREIGGSHVPTPKPPRTDASIPSDLLSSIESSLNASTGANRYGNRPGTMTSGSMVSLAPSIPSMALDSSQSGLDPGLRNLMAPRGADPEYDMILKMARGFFAKGIPRTHRGGAGYRARVAARLGRTGKTPVDNREWSPAGGMDDPGVAPGSFATASASYGSKEDQLLAKVDKTNELLRKLVGKSPVKIEGANLS